MDIQSSLLNFIIPSDHADTAAVPAQGGSNVSMLVMLAVFFLFMYFVMWRPQNKRAKEHRNLINSLTKGDEVVTAGGLLGKIVKVTDSYIVLAVTDNAEIVMQKSSIASALPKGTLKSI